MKRMSLKLASALCLVLAFAPVCLLMAATQMPDAPWQWVPWPLAAALVAVCAGALPGRFRLMGAGIGLGLLAVAMVLWLPRALWFLAPLVLALYVALIQRARAMPFEEWSPAVLLVGLAVHLVCMMLSRTMDVEWLYPAQRWLLLGYVPVLLLLGNRVALESDASGRNGMRPPRRIRSGNRWLVLAVSALVVAAANWGAIRDAFYVAAGWLGATITRIILWITELLAPDTLEEAGGGGGAGGMDLGDLGAGETSPFWAFLEKVLGWLGLVVLAAGFAYLLYRVAKLLIAASRRAMDRLREAARQLGEGVQDRTESILDWEELRDTAQARMRQLRRRFARPPRWEALDNRSRVRWSYAQWRQRTPRVADAMTARDALARADKGERMADIYERARYSDAEISEADAAYMREASRRG